MLRLTHLSRYILCLVLVVTVSACSKQVAEQNNEQGLNPSFLSSAGEKADPNYEISFPYDHLPHDAFDIEWWYLTANLEGDDGQDYALQWTLFRFAQHGQDNAWYQGQTYMAHASLHSPQQHWFEERFAPGGLGNAGVNAKQGAIRLFMDDWLWQGLSSEGTLFPAKLNTTIADLSANAQISLHLEQSGPFVLQGENGYSIKSGEGKHASHYYSLPFINVSGALQLPSGQVKVSGKAWYDHEWTSTLLDSTSAGWDWMSLHFDNGDKLMAFRMRLNEQEDYQTGTYISASGEATTLSPNDIQLSVVESFNIDDRKLPLSWRVNIPGKDINIDVKAVKKDAYNPSIFGYYEGAVTVSGNRTGRGFLELTGY
jgi:predicted secreted hydrolase